MSSLYEGPQNAMRLRIRPSTVQMPAMPDMPMKSARKPASKAPAPAYKKRVPTKTFAERKNNADKAVKSVQPQTAKKQPSSSQGGAYKESEHPRDRFGRFAVKAAKATGRVMVGAAKVTGKAIKGTVKGVKSARKTLKRINASMRRRDALAHRERALKLHKREQAAGLKRKTAVRRRRRK